MCVRTWCRSLRLLCGCTSSILVVPSIKASPVQISPRFSHCLLLLICSFKEARLRPTFSFTDCGNAVVFFPTSIVHTFLFYSARIKPAHTPKWMLEHLLLSDPENGIVCSFFAPGPLQTSWPPTHTRCTTSRQITCTAWCGWCLSVCTANMLTSAGGYIEVTVGCWCSSREVELTIQLPLVIFLFTHPCGNILDRKPRCLERSK